jgi:hypothetical protein
MRRKEQVADMGEIRNLYEVLVVKHKGRKGDLRMDGRIILKLVLKK